MANSQTEPSDSRLDGQRIFDGDFHIQVPIEKLVPYIDDDEIRDKVDRFGAPSKHTSAFKGTYASEIEQPTAGAAGATTHGVAITTEDIVEVQEDMGVDAVIATPPPDGPYGSGRYPVVLKNLIQAYNEFVLDQIVAPEEGIYGSIMIPKWEPEAAVAEIDRHATEPGIVAVADWISYDRPLGAMKYDPIFEKLEEVDLPLVLHSGGEFPERRTLIGDSYVSLSETLTTGFLYPTTAIVLNMIMSGVFEKFPDVDVVIQEVGVNWISTLAHRSDEIYQNYPEDMHLVERLHELDLDYLPKLPSKYLFEHFHVTTQPIALPSDRSRQEAVLELCRAEDMFIFSTDWPHGSMDSPDWLFDSPAVSDDMRERITHGNAEDVFGIEVTPK